MASTGLWRAVRMSKAAECIQDLWPLAFLVFFLIHNMAEVTILWQNCLEWGLCVATVVSADPRLRASLEPAWEEFSPDSLAEYA